MLARQRRALTRVALANEIGVARQTITAWETGTQVPSGANVMALSGCLQYPVEFFFGPELEPLPVGAVSFRALTKMTASTRDLTLAAGRTAVLINDWIEARYRAPRPDVPTLGLQTPEQAADVVRHQWGLGYAPIGNLLHLLESRGVRVFSLPPECQTADAFSLRWYGTPLILLTPGKSAERRRFDLAHELGHLVLHTEREGFQGPGAEDEANRFAASFLMPRQGLIARPLRGATLDTVLSERRRWKVAAMALTYRLNELGFLSEWEYRSLCVELSRRGYRRSEPGGVPQESSLLLGKVITSLRARQQGLGEIAEAVSLTTDEVAQHLLGLVVMPVSGAVRETSRSSQQQRPSAHLRLA
jgi:Zn-dependent peptidase ImmA (M78 family)/DNA-binding XRE family transcriptional regulator